MDDGSQNRKSLYFNTQQFEYDSQLRLLHILQRQFGLNGSLNRDKQYFRIRLYQESAQRCKLLIKHLIPNSMQYKLPL